MDGTFRMTCVTCTNLVKNAEKLQKAGLRVSRAPYDVSQYTELPESSPTARAFSAVLIHKKSSVIRVDGAVERVDPEERAIIEIALARIGQTWIVQDIATANVTAQ